MEKSFLSPYSFYYWLAITSFAKLKEMFQTQNGKLMQITHTHQQSTHGWQVEQFQTNESVLVCAHDLLVTVPRLFIIYIINKFSTFFLKKVNNDYQVSFFY